MQTNQPTQSTTVAKKRAVQTQMAHIRGSQTLLSIFILLLISVLLWILISVFATFNTSQIPAETKKMATPLTPTLSDTIFASLQSKRVFSEDELRSFPIYVIVRDSRAQTETVVPLGTRAPTATPAPTPAPTQSPAATQPPAAAPATPSAVTE